MFSREFRRLRDQRELVAIDLATYLCDGAGDALITSSLVDQFRSLNERLGAEVSIDEREYKIGRELDAAKIAVKIARESGRYTAEQQAHYDHLLALRSPR